MQNRVSNRKKNNTSLDGNNIMNDSNMTKHKNQSNEKSCKQMCIQIEGDRKSIGLLTFLYILQGVPLGLAGAIPYLLTSRKVSYTEQALFSFVYWPFSLKLLWAPIVDSLFVSWFGRRKSWLVPTQYLIGIFMLGLSFKITYLMDESNVNVYVLTSVFFILNFLAATQDVAVDGWALTMLSRKNVAWASTCNTVGQTAGYFIGNVVFLALESAEFCNTFLRSVPQTDGIVTLSLFLKGSGIIFLITTTLVALLKKEEQSFAEDEEELGLKDTYKLLVSIFKLKSVQKLVVILLTAKIGFAACDSVTALKLIEGGVPKEKLALFSIPMIPVQIILPIVISKYTTGSSPMSVFLKAMPFRLVGGVWLACLVWWAPHTRPGPDLPIPGYFYVILLISYALHQITIYSMYVASMSFSATISDPAIGGTYMTLLNTISNLGGNWPATIMLWMVDPLTRKSCDGNVCHTVVDGYYIESIICVCIGFAWIHWKSNTVHELQQLKKEEWTIKKSKYTLLENNSQ